MVEFIIHSIAFLYLISGSLSDLKTREVFDWSNYGLIATGFFINIVFSIVFKSWTYIVSSVFGFSLFLLVSLLMYYSGQWGGGDSKLLMGLGSLYGIPFTWGNLFPSIVDSFLVAFLLNTVIAGAIYGILWSFGLAIRNRKKFIKEYNKIAQTKKKLRVFAMVLLLLGILSLVLVQDTTFKILFSTSTIIISLTFYFWMVLKAVENSTMYKYLTPNQLTEGDWIAKDVMHKGKYICGPKDLGITKQNIQKLKKLNITKVLVKEGIPFVPSFLLGWLMTLFLGNLVTLIL